MRQLDGFDRQLLRVLQRDADLTSDAIAQKVALSPSAVQRRLKRLKALGIIAATIAVVDPDKVGRPSTFIVGVEVERERPELLARLRAWLITEEAVQQAFYVTGNSDYILVISAPNVGAYDQLMTRLMTDNPNVRRFTTNVALGVVKRGLLVPIPDSDS